MPLPTVADRVHGSASLRRYQAGARALGRGLADVEVVGADLVPRTGPVVLAMNHRAFVDGPLIFGNTPRVVTCLVKIEAFTPTWRPILLRTGQLPVVRDRIDVAPVRLCLRVLAGGGVVGIFPEGGRGDGLVRHAKPGAAYLAMRTGAAVVPVAFHGTDAIGHHPRPRVRIVYGAPFTVPPREPGRLLNRRVVATEAERVRARLADHVRATAARSTEVAA